MDEHTKTSTPHDKILFTSYFQEKRDDCMVNASVAGWVIQRVCAVLLIIAAPIKLFTGYAMVRKLGFIDPATALTWHSNAALDIILIITTSFHVGYGIRTILLDFGAGREKELFWGLTISSFMFSLIIIYYAYVG